MVDAGSAVKGGARENGRACDGCGVRLTADATPESEERASKVQVNPFFCPHLQTPAWGVSFWGLSPSLCSLRLCSERRREAQPSWWTSECLQVSNFDHLAKKKTVSDTLKLFFLKLKFLKLEFSNRSGWKNQPPVLRRCHKIHFLLNERWHLPRWLTPICISKPSAVFP